MVTCSCSITTSQIRRHRITSQPGVPAVPGEEARCHSKLVCVEVFQNRSEGLGSAYLRYISVRRDLPFSDQLKRVYVLLTESGICQWISIAVHGSFRISRTCNAAGFRNRLAIP